MALDFNAAMAAKDENLKYAYDDAKTMLYALSVGMGCDPLNADELDFVYEKNLRAMPTLATVIAWGARDVKTLGVDYAKVLHGEQRLTIHKALPVAADLLVNTRTKGLYDKGVGKGALVVSEINIRLAQSDEPLCTLETTHFARSDGGFSTETGDSGETPKPHILPDRTPDFSYDAQTTPSQPLFYRLLGDRNILHADPDAARAAGFERPILHGLCTYGICCHAVLKTVCDYKPERIKQFDVRFSAPVFPGEALAIDIWRDGKTVSFRARSKDRDAVVINNGLCRLTN
ncbi:MAG: MaoC/PaaZ C-terminal domain-containing protein [Pseudomonadota bacterium]